MPAGRRLLLAAGVAGAAIAAFEAQRRRDLAAVRRDPEGDDLSAPVHGATVEVRSRDGTRLHAEVHGPENAPALVLSHGWLESVELWQRQVAALAGSFRVVTFDHRGHGRSAVPDDPGAYTDEHLADDLNAVLEACLPAGRRCVIAGHSMGGMAIVAWAARHPAAVSRRLAGAVLVNTGVDQLVARQLVLGPLASARMQMALYPPMLRLYRPLTTQLDPATLRVVRRIVGGRRTTPAQAAFYHRMFLAAPAPVRTGFGRMLGSLDLRAAVASLTVPAVVIAGADDRLLPPVHSEGLAESLPRLVAYEVLEGVGHMAPVEAPDAVNASLRRLAAGIDPPAGGDQPSPRRRRAAATVKGVASP